MNNLFGFKTSRGKLRGSKDKQIIFSWFAYSCIIVFLLLVFRFYAIFPSTVETALVLEPEYAGVLDRSTYEAGLEIPDGSLTDSTGSESFLLSEKYDSSRYTYTCLNETLLLSCKVEFLMYLDDLAISHSVSVVAQDYHSYYRFFDIKVVKITGSVFYLEGNRIGFFDWQNNDFLIYVLLVLLCTLGFLISSGLFNRWDYNE